MSSTESTHLKTSIKFSEMTYMKGLELIKDLQSL